ncbi:hypothetical protein [Agriterribacter sp.]|uniref:glycosyl-4,4'-diaponeurosporenoate acyltransferase CrtO family protein n=1 Tax=Agriterribacter sp. TaxID=2821509 RepID=UPI002BAAD692|nr:hypothetical protein [Agriterribacter sp.]HTN05958.1 hypothetical protein [Agriterribacter sp.]
MVCYSPYTRYCILFYGDGQRTYFYERFHFIVWVFMLAASVYALLQFDYWWTLTFIISNILYNICPMFLQQYNRIRIEMLIKRRNT